jgi:HSP20 family molecular chaperone IbpA
MNSKGRNSRISIPAKIINLLLFDDEFFREVCGLKKANLTAAFPKYDQWCDSEGSFHMEFALAGYSPKDLEIFVAGNEFSVRTIRAEREEQKIIQEEDESFSQRDPQPRIQQGAILRGIARRNFSCSFYISQEFDISGLDASMENGLLHVRVPANNNVQIKKIKINNGE